MEELQDNLGVSRTIHDSWYTFSSEDTPLWVDNNFGEGQNNVRGYWTMTPYANDSRYALNVKNFGGRTYTSGVHYWHAGTVESDKYNGVRPVINLLKNAIE